MPSMMSVVSSQVSHVPAGVGPPAQIFGRRQRRCVDLAQLRGDTHAAEPAHVLLGRAARIVGHEEEGRVGGPQQGDERIGPRHQRLAPIDDAVQVN